MGFISYLNQIKVKNTLYTKTKVTYSTNEIHNSNHKVYRRQRYNSIKIAKDTLDLDNINLSNNNISSTKKVNKC
jgi:hypothetical protein